MNHFTQLLIFQKLEFFVYLFETYMRLPLTTLQITLSLSSMWDIHSKTRAGYFQALIKIDLTYLHG